MKRLLLVPIAVAAWVAFEVTPVPAEAPEAAGWWWKGNVPNPLLPIPRPPTVPEGGLYVAADPTGRAGVSALRLTIPEGASVGPVTMRVASTQGTPAIQACPSPITWTPEQGGPITSAPPDNCAGGSVVGAYNEAAATITFEVSPFVTGGVLNIVLVPQAGAVFQTSFQKPGDDTIQVQTAPPVTDSGGGGQESFNPADLPGFEGTAFLPEEGVLFEPPPVVAAPSVTTPPATVAGPSRPAVTVPGQSPELASSEEQEAARTVAAVVFLALVGLYLWVMRAPGRPPRLIGPMAALATGGRTVRHAESPVPARGVGRFRRVRSGTAPRL